MVYTVRPRSQTPESLRTSPTERLDLPLLSLYFSSVLPICPPPPSVLPTPLSFLPLCPSYPSTHLYITLRPPPYPSSDLCPFCSALPSQLRPLPLPSPPVPFLPPPSSVFSLFLTPSSPPVPSCCPLSSLFLFSSLFSTSSTSARARLSARLLHPTPPHLTTQPDLFQHSSSPHFPSILSSPHVSSPLLPHSFSPLPLLFAWSPNLLSFSSLPPLFATLSSSLFHLHPSPHISPLLKDRIREEQNPLISRYRGFSSSYRSSSSPAITVRQHSPFKTNHLSTPDHRFTYQHLINTLSTYQQCIFISPVQPNVTALQGAVLADRS